MQRIVRFCAQAAFLGCLAYTALAADNHPSVGIYLSFESLPAAASVEAMKQAVEKLLAPTGVRVAWRSISENSGTETFANLAVIRFRGSCETRAPRPPNLFGSWGETHPLASTGVSDGHVLPYTNVECDEVRKTLDFVRQGAGVLERERALGLALGRVVAHELYHILADTTEHAEKGIAKASHMLPDLVAPGGLTLDAGSSDAIQNKTTKEK